jgi:hypothetical protein
LIADIKDREHDMDNAENEKAISQNITFLTVLAGN